MSRLLDDDQDLMPRQDRELTLSTGAILAIFLGLVLLCGVFFGFGYNLGRKSTTIAASVAQSNENTDADATNFDSFKPSATAPEPKPVASTTVSQPPAQPSNAPPASESAKPAPVTRPQPMAPAAVHTAAAPPVTERPTPAFASAAPATTPNGAFVVQIAAISRKDDADMLVTALRSKGYEVAARSAPQDKLLHIQVGPFVTKAEAEDMRKRLLADGYNAILK